MSFRLLLLFFHFLKKPLKRLGEVPILHALA
jgi:hypothetical protein